jgi:endoglucanase
VSRAPRLAAALLTAAVTASTLLLGATSPASAAVADGTRFFVPEPNPDALKQITKLSSAGKKTEAARIRSMVSTPTGVWLTGGSAAEVEDRVRRVTTKAAGEQTVPLLVLYNIPFRDCGLYSAGGAATPEAYRAWVDGVVRGIGDRAATVTLGPDSLGIVPWYTNRHGQLESCQPAAADPATAAPDRFALLRYAVQQISALPHTSVYLDGTNSGWLNVGEITDRLLKAGVEQADGFFLNTSNFAWTRNLEQYGTWISSCIAYVTQVKPGDLASCGDQYWNGGPATNWQGTRLDPARVWSDTDPDPSANTVGLNSRYAALLGDVRPTKTFLIDTSRNGGGPWTPSGKQTAWPDPQTWCNPPGRGVGPRPTTATGTPLADAYVWIKVPGESDGQCSRGLGSGTVSDPVWGRVDPAAGAWFPEEALELTRLANPALPTGA